jgi:ribosomal protein S27E
MSALGQKQTSDWWPLMSALLPKADIAGRHLDVRFVPKADSCTAAKKVYSITSSALACSVCGTVKPSVLAGTGIKAIARCTANVADGVNRVISNGY